MAGPATAAPQARMEARPATAYEPWLADALVLVAAWAVVATAWWYLAHVFAPITRVVPIDLSPRALPAYALFSFTRVVISYGLSLLYTVVYGTIAAKNPRAERVMIPILDVLQGVPVLGFLPGVGLALVGWFSTSNLGIELTCILMIFTAMPWNMAYSYFSSLRTIPEELEAVARIYRFSWWERFTRLELPMAMNGLVWNSMMSVAGGWFFLMILEVFSLRTFAIDAEPVKFVLPGIGAYLATAYEQGDWSAVAWALVAMTLIVVLTDRLVWKPVVAWAQRFKYQDARGSMPKAWLGAFLARSHVVASVEKARNALAASLAGNGVAGAGQGPIARLLGRSRILTGVRRGGRATGAAISRALPRPHGANEATARHAKLLLGRAAAAAFVALGAWIIVRLVGLLLDVTLARWGEILVALLLTTLRLFAAVVAGALLMVPIGVLIGISPRLARRAQPVVQVVASFPAPMFFPIITTGLVWLLGERSFGWTCIALTLFATQWYILFNVIAGAMTIPDELHEAARVYRVRGLGRWRTLLMPGVMPYLVTGLFTAAGGAWNGAIVAELQKLEGGRTIVARGLGAMLVVATEKGDYGTLTACVLVLVVTIILLNRFLWSPLHHAVDERYASTS